jgi:AcrR family transcriptional regulator
MLQKDSAEDASVVDQRSALAHSLIAAAERLVAGGSSYPEITVQRLADEAGISRWRFYETFGDKYELLRTWFADLNEQFEKDHDAWLRLDASVSPSTLRSAVATLFLPYQQHSAMHAAMYDSADSDPNIRALLDMTENRRIGALRAHIDRGQSEGWVDANLDSEETAIWLVLCGGRAYQQSVSEGGGLTPNDFIDAYATLAWYVLYDRGSRRPQ